MEALQLFVPILKIEFLNSLIHELHVDSNLYFRYANIYKIPKNLSNIRQYVMYGVNCGGSEKDVWSCRNRWNIRTCSDQSIIGVSCGEILIRTLPYFLSLFYYISLIYYLNTYVRYRMY